jgi:uncharacterized protein YndB with AHSA1/START domain
MKNDSTYVSVVIDAPIERVWAENDSFTAIARWHPAVLSATMLDNASDTQVGGVRVLDIQGGVQVVERLLELCPERHSCTYEFVKAEFPVEGYKATLRFTPVTLTNQTFAEWEGHWQVADENRQSSRDAFTGIYTGGLTALVAKLARQ